MKLKIIALLLALSLSALSLMSCTFKHIEDTNGTDASLTTITEDELFGKKTSYVELGALYAKNGNIYTYNVAKLSGVRSVAKFSADGAELVITTNITLSAGNCRIVLMNNGEYIGNIAFGEDMLITVANPSGSYEVRIAGESAKLDFELTYSFG